MRGGRREGAGRPPSSMQATRAASLAREHAEQAIAILADLMHNAQSEHTRVAAANAILDRGWGKPVAPTFIEGDNPDSHITVSWVSADETAEQDRRVNERLFKLLENKGVTPQELEALVAE